MRRARQKTKKHWGRRLLVTIVILLVIIGIGAVFFPQLNNTWRNATGGNDTAADTAVKTQLVKQLNNQKTGNTTTDAMIDKATAAIQNTKMATLMKAADDQQTAINLLTNAGVTPTAASVVTKVIYADPSFDTLRQKLAAGDYVGVYQAAKTLQKNGTGSTLSSALQSAGQ